MLNILKEIAILTGLLQEPLIIEIIYTNHNQDREMSLIVEVEGDDIKTDSF